MRPSVTANNPNTGKLSMFLQFDHGQYRHWKRTNAHKLRPLENKRTKTSSREQTQKKGRVDSPDWGI